jgi:hypothetical protein
MSALNRRSILAGAAAAPIAALAGDRYSSAHFNRQSALRT